MNNDNQCKVLGRIDTATLQQRVERSKLQRKQRQNAARSRRANKGFRSNNNNPFQALVLR